MLTTVGQLLKRPFPYIACVDPFYANEGLNACINCQTMTLGIIYESLFVKSRQTIIRTDAHIHEINTIKTVEKRKRINDQYSDLKIGLMVQINEFIHKSLLP